MDYEKKYKEALERAVNLFVTNNISATAACEIFPELNESEEINYEQKYKNALERARVLMTNQNPPAFDKHLIEIVFPELKESKDERIRKTIYGWIYTRPSQFFDNGFSKEEMLAWVEKQNKQSSSNIPSRELILSIWDLGNEWKELTNGCISTKYGTQLDFIQKHWHESEYYLKEKQGKQTQLDYEHADIPQKDFAPIEPKKLDADKVIAWLNDQSCLGWIEDVEVDKFVEQFKKDFEL